ncbi:MAG: bacteriocin-protection protein [Sphingobacteriales bacterium]|nr:MAG: bacteriocin-protection protein [Sphingobacteriales bacterium]
MAPIFFASPLEFRNWLNQHHATESELLVGFYKVGSKKPTLTWSESVDEALCFGWIDGVRTSIDADRYQIRFTPRKKGSIWSRVNIRKVALLTEQGRMQPAGTAAFEARQDAKSEVYAFEQETVTLTPEQEMQFAAHEAAWTYFNALAPSYRKTAIHWVTTAKQEATRHKRLLQIIADSENGINRWKDTKYKK